MHAGWRELQKDSIVLKQAKDTITAVEHSHFAFAVHDEGETLWLDPWILFRQMYRDAALNSQPAHNTRHSEQ